MFGLVSFDKEFCQTFNCLKGFCLLIPVMKYIFLK